MAIRGIGSATVRPTKSYLEAISFITRTTSSILMPSGSTPTPAMISAGCGLKTCNSCKSDNSTYEVVDKHRNRFVTKCVCRYCYNVMYNCKPLSLFKFSKEIISMTPDSVRLSFTTESGNITEQILNKAQQAFIYEKNIQEDNQSTRGHFKRGVL